MSEETIKEYKTGEYWETWYTIKCPECGKLNWVCNGDENDLTTIDIELVICWNCEEKFRTSQIDPIAEEITGHNGCMNEEKGKEKP